MEPKLWTIWVNKYPLNAWLTEPSIDEEGVTTNDIAFVITSVDRAKRECNARLKQ